MRTFVSSFTPQTPGVTVELDPPFDDFVADHIHFQVTKNGSNVNMATGFSNGTANRGQYTLNSTAVSSARSTTYSIFAEKNSSGSPVAAVEGKPSATWNTTPGELSFDFNTADGGYTVDFMAIEA